VLSVNEQERADMANRKPVIYVVDDERVIAETLAIILKQAGFVAFSFQDPREALAAVQSGPSPDLLISDVVMPEISGIELAIQFQQNYPRCKVLLFSGQAATANLLEMARKQGHNFELMSKPIHPVDLLARLRAYPQTEEEAQTQFHDSSKVARRALDESPR
jgi:DNA-binding NtrC family response regulator